MDGVFGLSGDLIDLIDIDDAVLGTLNVVICCLNETQQDVFDVFADIAGFRQSRCVRNGERNVQKLCKRLRKIGLADAGGTKQQHVALCNLHAAVFTAEENALIVVIDRHRERHFGFVLPDDVFIELLFDLLRLRQHHFGARLVFRLRAAAVERIFIRDDVHAELYAFVTDIHAVAGDQALCLRLRLPAEGAAHFVIISEIIRHENTPFRYFDFVAMTLSIRPYSMACCAVMKLSRSVSLQMTSYG